jgi:hypothetical protein
METPVVVSEETKQFEYMSDCTMEFFDDLDDHKMQRSYLGILLAGKPLLVTFEKKNGDVREMLCTLNEASIPEHKRYFATDRAESTEILAVYDLQKEDWRSFRIASVQNIEYLQEEKIADMVASGV